jgi:glycine cleavage system H protein
MKLPADLRYTASHEWIRTEADGTLTVGITDHAQSSLGDLVFLELPKPGRKVAAGEAVAVVESVKAASDVYAPVTGEVVDANEAIVATPEAVNQDAYAAWLFRIRPAGAIDAGRLLDAAAYEATVGED